MEKIKKGLMIFFFLIVFIFNFEYTGYCLRVPIEDREEDFKKATVLLTSASENNKQLQDLILPSIVISKKGDIIEYRNPRLIKYFNIKEFGITFNIPVLIAKSCKKALHEIKAYKINRTIIAIGGSMVYASKDLAKDVDVYLVNLPNFSKEDFKQTLASSLKEELKRYFNQGRFNVETFIYLWGDAIDFYFKIIDKSGKSTKIYLVEIHLTDWSTRGYRVSIRDQATSLMLRCYYDLKGNPVTSPAQIGTKIKDVESYINFLSNRYRYFYGEVKAFLRILKDTSLNSEDIAKFKRVYEKNTRLKGDMEARMMQDNVPLDVIKEQKIKYYQREILTILLQLSQFIGDNVTSNQIVSSLREELYDIDKVDQWMVSLNPDSLYDLQGRLKERFVRERANSIKSRVIDSMHEKIKSFLLFNKSI